MPIYVWLLVFHPILVTLLALIVLVLLLRWTGLWARYKYRILLALLAAYAIDAAFALPRIVFAYGLSKDPTVAQQIPPPKSLVLVSVLCDAKCHDWLISGAVDEIISVTPRQPRFANATTAVRYRAGWTRPGTCPHERARTIWAASAAQRQSGYCPVVEPVEIPTQGVFVIHEGAIVTAREAARPYTPAYLSKAPPGPVIRFFGIEVQNRTADGIAALASAYRYEAPGLLGLPPLIGCWDRPDNVIFILPPGDTGCGFWRWFTWGGNDQASHDAKWVFAQAFGPPDRPLVPPKRPELPPATPAQALEILSNTNVEFYLPDLREALLDPANSDDVLTNLVVRLARRGTLEGALIGLLAANRPATLAGLSDRLDPFPKAFATSGAVLDEMEKSAKFRDEFADTMLLALATNWQAPGNDIGNWQAPRNNIGRFVNLMEVSHPGWFCERLGRFTGPNGILKMRENGAMKNVQEGVPPFIAPIVEKTAPRCPDATIDLLQALPRARDLVFRLFCEAQKKNGGLQDASARTKEFCPR
jgi:hypothetical protein